MQSLDRNTIIGFVLIGLLLVVFTIYNQPTKEQVRAKFVHDSTAYAVRKAHFIDSVAASHAPVQKVNDTTKVAANDTTPKKAARKYYTIENENLKATISNYGAQIVSVELKKYKTWDQKRLFLFGDSTNSNPDNANNNLSYVLKLGASTLDTRDLAFNATDSSFIVKGKDTKSIAFNYHTPDGKIIEQDYSLHGDSNIVNYEVKIDGKVTDLQYVLLNWKANLNRTEKVLTEDLLHTNIYFKSTDEDVDHIGEGSNGDKKIVGNIDWVSYKQQYFNSALITKAAFERGDIKVSLDTMPGKLRKYESDLYMNYKAGQTLDSKMAFYFGPNSFYKLKKYDIGLEKVIPTGIGIFKWFAGPVNRWFIIPLFDFLGGYIANYGIIILLMTILIKIILYPLTYRSMVSAAKMRIVKPEIDELKEKYKDDQAKFGQEQLKLFRTAGVSPLGGCIPTLLQLPILVAMYSFFPGSIELRQQHFLWAKDLSSYDSIYNFGFAIPWYGDHVSLFTLLMTVSSILFAVYNNQLSGATGQMKWMAYIMPIFLLGIFNKLSAALTYYYFLQNVVSFIQQWVIQRFFMDEAAIHRQIQENKKKTPKKGGFMSRLEQMQRQQKDLQRNRKK